MGRADWAIVTGWQKLLLGAALCLPIPALSISGLTLPLPTAVYRVAIAIAESTQELAGVLTGTDADRGARPRAQAALSPSQQRAQPSGSPRRAAPQTAPLRASARRPEPADSPARARSLVASSGKQPPSPRPRSRSVRARAVPVTGATNAAADMPITPPASGPGPEVKNERSPTDPTPRRGEVAPVEPAPIAPPPIAPGPQPPPALEPEPRVLEPVTETLRPVIDLAEPVQEPLRPVTDTVDRLGVLRP
jgi:hypothetical protein